MRDDVISGSEVGSRRHVCC